MFFDIAKGRDIYTILYSLYRKIGSIKVIIMDEKDRLVEGEFKEWLDSKIAPYWYIKRDMAGLSPMLKKYIGKIPNFIILIPNVGFILADVQYKNPLKYAKFAIDAEETMKCANLERYISSRVWYVFSSAEYHFNTWFWIPTSKVLEKGKKRFSTTGKEYFTVSIKETIQVAGTDNLGRLFSEICKFY